jgi:transketolase
VKTLGHNSRPVDVPFGASYAELAALARNLRYQVVQMSHASGAPHLGSSLSCLDILIAAYWRTLRIDPTDAAAPIRDRFILSKGHAAPALYTCLAARGFFPEAWLDTFASSGGKLAEQPAPNCAPGVELATGSLGHGLPVGCGLTLAARIQNLDYRTLVVMSDGECNEGSVWEAAMFAAGKALGRLTVVIDYNKWQATGRSDEVLALSSLRDKWRAFGWDASEVDGHDIDALAEAISPRGETTGRPRALIAHTVKGKGVSFMEDDNNWHYRIPDAAELERAAELLATP